MVPQQERGGLSCRGRRVAVFLSEAPCRGGMVIQAEGQGCGTQVTCRKGPISLVGLLEKFSVRPGLSGCLPMVPGAGARDRAQCSHLGDTCSYAKIRSDRGLRLFLF